MGPVNQEEIAPKVVSNELTKNNGIWFGEEGHYWSNLNIDENRAFLQDLTRLNAKDLVKKHFPQHFDVIFSPKRAGGLIFLDPRPGDVVVDAGCMWGALTIPLAKAGCRVIGIDQTLESLLLLRQRALDENLSNVELVCSDMNKTAFNDSSFDKIIANGVLEWIPATFSIEVKKYHGEKAKEPNSDSKRPDELQKGFLSKIYRGLKPGGSLYLAIENRYNIFYFLGVPDPHCNLRFITFMPRPVQNLISRVALGRPYVNWIYSPEGLKRLLISVGFRDVDMHYAFPDYRFPEYILTDVGMGIYQPFLYASRKNNVKKVVTYGIEKVIYQKLKLSIFAPSIIAIARKGG